MPVFNKGNSALITNYTTITFFPTFFRVKYTIISPFILNLNFIHLVSRDSAVGIATAYGLDDRRFVQTGSGAHPASYLVGTGGSFPGDKAAGS
jgi:hypothetical protein